jgi:segregation and condensation protein A
MEQQAQYKVELDAFTGPLDLLLYLVRHEEVDIARIPISRIADEYLRYVSLMQKLNIELAGDFLVMAATLMEIKSRTLLPTPPLEDDEEWEDPCQELVLQLMEYRRFKEAAEALTEKAEERDKRFARPGERLPEDPQPATADA